MWKINAGRRSAFSTEFIEHGVVAIGWREIGNPVGVRSREEMLARTAVAYPDRTDRQNEVGSAQIWRFLTEIQVGDSVTTYDPIDRVYHLGKVTGAPVYAPDAIEQLPTQRAVHWSASVSRDTLSAGTI